MSSSRLVSVGAGVYREARLRVPAPPRVRARVWVALALVSVSTLVAVRRLRPPVLSLAAPPRVTLRTRLQSPPPSPEPPPVPLTDVVQLEQGQYGTWLALTRNGSLYSWKSSSRAVDLGVTTRARARPIPAWAPLDRVHHAVRQLSCRGMGDQHDQFTVFSRGQEAQVRTEDRELPEVVAPTLASGDHRDPALLSDRSVYVWIERTATGLVRAGSHCEPREDYYSDRAQPPAAPLDVPDVVEVAASDRQACAVTARGEVWCWAFYNLPEQYRDDPRDQIDYRDGPRRVPVAPVSGVVLDDDRGCGVARDGSVWCWSVKTPPPVRWQVWQHSRLREVTRLHLAGGLCATLRDGRFVCDPRWRPHPSWLPSPTWRPSYTEHAGLRGAAQVIGCVASAGCSGCARFEDGTARCWGDGELPDGRLRASTSPVRADVPNTLVTLAAGARHVCGLTREGTVWCWGDYLGATGFHSEQARHRPSRIEGVTDVVQLAVGAWETCALVRGGSVVCWGGGGPDSYAPHDRPPEDPSPRNVEGITNAVELSAGDHHVCARLTDDTVRCWGEFGNAWPGHPRVRGAIRPLDVALPLGATRLVSAGRHACARLTTGSYACWGGDGAMDDQGNTNPIETGALRLAEGSRVVPSATSDPDCVISADASLRCGVRPDDQGALHASEGELFAEEVSAVAAGGRALCVTRRTRANAVSCYAVARPTRGEDVPVPGDVTVPRPVRALAAGEGFACALDADGVTWCWGVNDRGQLGTGVAGSVSPDAPARVVR